MLQWVRVLTAKPDNIIIISGTHTERKKGTDSHKLSSNPHIHTKQNTYELFSHYWIATCDLHRT